MSSLIKKYGLYCAWVIACLGMIGSLYFSDIKHYEPCHLCWFQRVALFPLAFILGIGAYHEDKKVAYYAIPLVLIGLIFASYQILLQQIPGWEPLNMCGAGPNCSEKINIGLGFISLPMLSAANFLLLATLLYKQSK